MTAAWADDDGPKKSFLDDLLNSLESRVVACTEPYQGMVELGCFAEVVHKSLAALFEEDAKQHDLEYWKVRHGCPSLVTVFKTAYGLRNKSAHETEEKHLYREVFVRSTLDQFKEATMALAAVLPPSFLGRLFEQQSSCLPYRLARTLGTAASACTATPALSSAFAEYAAAAQLHPQLVEALARSARNGSHTSLAAAELRDRVILELASKDLNATSNHLLGLARALAAVLPLEEYRRHLASWFSRNAFFERDRSGATAVRTLRVTVDHDPQCGYVFSRVELLHPPKPALQARLTALSERPLVQLGDLVGVLESIEEILIDHVSELADHVVIVRTPRSQADIEFHALGDRRGLLLGELCRCLTVQVLREHHQPNRQRSLEGANVRRPESVPTNSRVLDTPHICRDIARLWRDERFFCLLALERSAATREHVREVIQSFEEYPLAIVDRVGAAARDEQLAALFGEAEACPLGVLFDRVTQLRHPRSGAGVPLLVLWDDRRYDPVAPQPF